MRKYCNICVLGHYDTPTFAIFIFDSSQYLVYPATVNSYTAIQKLYFFSTNPNNFNILLPCYNLSFNILNTFSIPKIFSCVVSYGCGDREQLETLIWRETCIN